MANPVDLNYYGECKREIVIISLSQCLRQVARSHKKNQGNYRTENNMDSSDHRHIVILSSKRCFHVVRGN